MSVATRDNMAGKFVVSKHEQPGLGLYVALVTGPAGRRPDSWCLFLWDQQTPRAVTMSTHEIEKHFEIFDDEQGARERLQKLKGSC